MRPPTAEELKILEARYPAARQKRSLVESAFVRELDRQCRFAKLAAQGIDLAWQSQSEILTGPPAAIQDRQSELSQLDTRLWFEVQNLLVALANISKVLWPSDKTATRGAALRLILDVSDTSPLSSRMMRNHFEHFDGRLERWAAAADTRNIVDTNICPAGAIAGFASADYLRNYDPFSAVLSFQGDQLDLKAVMAAVHDLHEKIRTTLNQ